GILAAWETTGLTAYGPSPFAATINAPGAAVAGLTRASGVGTVPTAGANAWGGTGFVFANEAAAITGNSFATFGITNTSSGTMSVTNIAAYNIRRSGTGSSTGVWQYQVGNGAFTDIGSAITWGSVTTSSGNLQTAIDFSGISALQNIPAGTGVTFRIVLWGGTGTGGWYINNVSGYDLVVSGSFAPIAPLVIAPVITIPPAPTNVFAGNNAGFRITATGSGPLNYQWLKGGAPIGDAGAISGAQTNALNFIPAATNHAGTYSVIVTNLGGGVTSSVALLNVVTVPALSLSNSANGLVLGADNGAVSNRFIVQMTTNLAAPAVWVPIQTNVIGADGKIRFTETNNTDPFHFYRLLFP
ncbi:MAG: immunoglobulin domain-containing protein, partial [Verrucomicrobiota bacterium]